MSKVKEFLMKEGLSEMDALNVIAETEEMIWEGKWEEASAYLGTDVFDLI